MPSSTKLSAPLERAFPSHPRVDRYFPAGSTEAARQRIAQAVLRGEGTTLLIGAPGVGKSMLLEVLANDLTQRIGVVRLASSQLCTRRALLQAILHGLGGPYKNREEGELRLSLADLLSDSGQPVALLIDEAQTLPVRLLEELRQLTNLTVDGTPMLRLVLAGTNALDEAFTVPDLDSFNQRLAARCYLEPLRREETSQYVRAHLAAAGGDPDQVIAADAYEAIALASDGLPRLINQVGDRAMVLGAERGSTQLDAALIGEAWSDLHQLAAPWQSPAASSLAAAAVHPEPSDIEFGLLDDEDQALQAEAEAVTALATEIGVDEAIWDAGDKLRELGAAETEPATEAVEDEDELVSYAFPNVAEEAEIDYELAEIEEQPASPSESVIIEQHEVDATMASGKKKAKESNPFAENFDEEELVLDPYAELERVIPAAIVVQSHEPSHLNEAFDALAVEVTAGGFDYGEPVEATVEVAATSEEVFQASASAQLEGDDILVVEVDDSPAIEAGACRQEYADLFANLRQG